MCVHRRKATTATSSEKFIYLFIYFSVISCVRCTHVRNVCNIVGPTKERGATSHTRSDVPRAAGGRKQTNRRFYRVPPSSPSSYLKSSRSRCRHFSFVSFSRSRHVGVLKERKDQTANENNTCCSGTRRFSVV